MSEKVQESPGIPAAARLPPDMVKLAGVWEFGLSISAVNVNVEPAPQESFAGIILAVAMKLGNSLLNVISVAPEVELVLVTVYSSVVVSPAVMVDGIKAILMIGAMLTTKRSLAELPTNGEPPTVANRVLETLLYVPAAALAGTLTLARMEHEPSGAMLPPLNERLVVPTPPTAPPQPLANRLSKVRLANAAPRSSLKATALAVEPRLRLLRVYSRITLAPGATGSSTNDLLMNCRGTFSVALALPLFKPPTNRSPDTLL